MYNYQFLYFTITINTVYSLPLRPWTRQNKSNCSSQDQFDRK